MGGDRGDRERDPVWAANDIVADHPPIRWSPHPTFFANLFPFPKGLRIHRLAVGFVENCGGNPGIRCGMRLLVNICMARVPGSAG